MKYALVKYEDKSKILLDSKTNKEIIFNNLEDCKKYIEEQFEKFGFEWKVNYLFKTIHDNGPMEFIELDSRKSIS